MEVYFDNKGNFDVTRDWLEKVAKNTPTASLSQIASDGESALAYGTPKDTGETAAGWNATIEAKPGGSEVSWINTAHPGESVNIAVILDQGHGTGTGGYVPARPYIKSSMDSVWATAGDKIAKELTE